jgi:lysophospholipase L1-like esterase
MPGWQWRLPAVSAVAMVTATALLAAPAILHARPKPPRGPAKRVFVVGDSLAVGTRPYLGRFLRGWRVATSASISKHAPQGVAELRHRRRSPVAVVSLGTNDDPRAVGTFDHAVHTALSIAGKDHCLVWPNIVRPAVGGATYAGYNRVLSSADAGHDNLIVVNWARMVAHNPGWLGDDGVHVNATGYTARARGIANAVRRCRGVLAGQGPRTARQPSPPRQPSRGHSPGGSRTRATRLKTSRANRYTTGPGADEAGC